MLPVDSVSDLFYPMTADIYYASETQGDLGNIVKSWNLDRTISCSAIKERAEYNAKYSVTAEKFVQFREKINFRSAENILESRTGELYRPTDVMIKNIRDPEGNLVWLESSYRNTTFEIESIEPMFNDLHVLAGYRALLARSDAQL